jgi:hypothetical protein
MLGKDVEQLQRRNRELVEAVSLAESRVRHCCRRCCEAPPSFCVTGPSVWVLEALNLLRGCRLCGI